MRRMWGDSVFAGQSVIWGGVTGLVLIVVYGCSPVRQHSEDTPPPNVTAENDARSHSGEPTVGAAPQAAELRVELTWSPEASVDAQTCGEVTAEAEGGVPPYKYSWSLPELSGRGPHRVCLSAPTTLAVRVTSADAANEEFDPSHAEAELEFPALAPTVDAGRDEPPTPTPVDASVPERPRLEHLPPPPLRDAPVGTEPFFDRDKVYFQATNRELLPSKDYVTAPKLIAPVDAPADFVYGLSWSRASIRNVDGRLIHDRHVFTRDALSDYEADIPIHDNDTPLPILQPCPDDKNQGRWFTIAWDGATYHDCPQYFYNPLPPGTDNGVYDEAGQRVWAGEGLGAIGPGNVAFRWEEGLPAELFRFPTGEVIATVDLGVDLTTHRFIAEKMKTDRAVFVFRENGTENRIWFEVGLDGQLLGSGEFEPLPPGVTYSYEGNSWAEGGSAAVDGHGCLYEFAFDGYPDFWVGDNLLIVRRPRAGEGTSDVPYRMRDMRAATEPMPLVEMGFGGPQLVTGQ